MPVTLAELASSLVAREEPSISAPLADVLRDDGVDERLDATVARASA